MQKYTCRLTPQFSKLHLDNTLLLAINIFGIILGGHLTSLMGRICKGHLNCLISWHLRLSVVHRFSVGLKWGFGKAIEAALCLSMPKPVVETPNVSRFQPLSHWLYVKWGDFEVVLLLHYSKHFVQCNCQQAVSGLGAVWPVLYNHSTLENVSSQKSLKAKKLPWRSVMATNMYIFIQTD